jgi:hypothetical protein
MGSGRKVRVGIAVVCGAALGLLASGTGHAGGPAAVTGVALPEGYREWVAVAPSHRTDKGHIRQMLANPIMVQAYRAGTLPFPDGSMIAKLVYAAVQSPTWEAAVVPGEPLSIEIMVKDSARFPENQGWGFGRFAPEGTPRGDAALYATCFPCHRARVTSTDYVFTRWAP